MVWELGRVGLLFVVALSWLKTIERLAGKGVISMEVSRKAIHVGIGVLFVTCWGLFPPECGTCRFYAALVPGSILLKFIATGLGLLKDPDTEKMLCRNGDASELLFGPMFYGFVIVAATVVYWTDIQGLLIICILCVGDGMAALGGMRFPIMQLPWNRQKTLGGVLSFVFCSALSIYFFVSYFSALGFAPLAGVPAGGNWILPSFLVILVSALVESCSLGAFDNLLVPGVTWLASQILYL